MQVVIKNPANTPHLVTVRQKEIFITPLLVIVIFDKVMLIASRLHRLMKINAVRVILRTTAIQYRGKICSATKPSLGSCDKKTRVHVNRRHIRVLHMCDQRNTTCPELWRNLRTRNLFPEFRRKFTMHCRCMHTNLLKYTPLHHGHNTAATFNTGIFFTVPWCANKTPGLPITQRPLYFIFQRLKFCTDLVPQFLKPRSCLGFTFFNFRRIHICF